MKDSERSMPNVIGSSFQNLKLLSSIFFDIHPRHFYLFHLNRMHKELKHARLLSPSCQCLFSNIRPFILAMHNKNRRHLCFVYEVGYHPFENKCLIVTPYVLGPSSTSSLHWQNSHWSPLMAPFNSGTPPSSSCDCSSYIKLNILMVHDECWMCHTYWVIKRYG